MIKDKIDEYLDSFKKRQDHNSHINETIDTATNRDLGRYATSIKNVALVTLGLCKKYRVFNDVDTYGYDSRKKMIQINGEDFYYLG